jgi:hypothetical protein
MLFTVSQLKAKQEAEAMKSHPEKCAKYISSEIEADLSLAIGKLTDERSYHFDTGTLWNLHDLVVYLVKEAGPCSLYLSTYAIKEYQARLFTGMKTEGLLTELHCLLDYRTPVHDADAVQLLESNVTSIGYMRTHSKLIVIMNESIALAVTGSANLTANTTADTGVITIHRAIAELRRNWILKHINNESK